MLDFWPQEAENGNGGRGVGKEDGNEVDRFKKKFENLKKPNLITFLSLMLT